NLLSGVLNTIPPQRITGRVTDSLGNPVEGASVRLTPGRKGTTTNANGTFTLSEVNPGNYTLEITLVGHLSIQRAVTVSHDAPVDMGNLTMKISPNTMEEITFVSTGYQKLSRQNVTGAVTTLGSKDLEKRNAVNILDNLEGTVPGLVRYQGRTTIRGISTLQAQQDVLVV